MFRYIIFPFTDVVHWLLLNFDSFPSFRSIHLLWCAFLSTPMLSRVIRYPTEEISYPFYPVLSDQSWWSLSTKLYFLIQNNRCQPLTKKWLIRAKVFFFVFDSNQRNIKRNWPSPVAVPLPGVGQLKDISIEIIR